MMLWFSGLWPTILLAALAEVVPIDFRADA